MMKPTDIMIDIETLSTKPNALVLTIGAVRFDPFADDSTLKNGPNDMDMFYARIDPESFTWPDVDIDDSTVAWWGKQSEAVREEAFSAEDRQPIAKVMEDFYKWCQPCERVWANGSTFDIIILENICRNLGRGVPWSYFQVRDARTVYKMVPYHERVNPALHHAAWDCWAQTVALQSCFNKLGVKELAR
jgi:hypothetical protein